MSSKIVKGNFFGETSIEVTFASFSNCSWPTLTMRATSDGVYGVFIIESVVYQMYPLP